MEKQDDLFKGKNHFEIEGVKISRKLFETLKASQQDNDRITKIYKDDINSVMHFLCQNDLNIEAELAGQLGMLSHLHRFICDCEIEEE